MLNPDFNRDSLLENAYELLEEGIPVIQLHPMDDNLKCTCNDPNCTKIHPETGEIKTLAGKHPMSKAWQKTPAPKTEDEVNIACDTLEATLHPSSTGLGAVLPEDVIIVDVDCKQGKKGFQSLQKLEHHIGLKLDEICGYKVNSGSGKPSAHYWFKKPAELEVRKTLKEYPDIDFLHSGNYVVIQGSCHQSGGIYEAEHGQSIKKITQAPKKLLDIIERQTQAFTDSIHVEAGACDLNDIEQALDWILQEHQGSVPYEDWFRICMALHFETSGSQQGYELFDAWSARGTNYGGSQDTYRKWQEGFKGSSVKVSGATILYMAQELGWERDYGVEVDLTSFINSLQTVERAKVVTKDGDELELKSELPESLYKMGGVFGTLLQWSLDNSVKPSVLNSFAAVMNVMSVIVGRDFTTDFASGNYTNINSLVVAESGQGKEHIIKVTQSILEQVRDRFPSERKTIAGKMSSYGALYSALESRPRLGWTIDEFGHFLESASGNKREARHAELIGFIMELFSRSSGSINAYELSKAGLSKEDREKKEKEEVTIKKPFVSIMGTTTPSKLMENINRTMIEDGFINRFLMWFPEEGDMPMRDFEQEPVPESFWHWVERVYIALGAVNGGKDKASLVRDDSEHPVKPKVVKFRGTEAMGTWREFEMEIINSKKQEKQSGFYPLFNRDAEYSIKIALLFQLCVNPMSEEISAKCMQQAIDLVRYLRQNQLRVFRLNFAENSVEKREKQIYSMVLDAGKVGITLDELLKSRSCSGLKKTERDDLFKVLLDKEMILMQDNNEGKGRPSNKKKIVFADKFADYVEDKGDDEG